MPIGFAAVFVLCLPCHAQQLAGAQAGVSGVSAFKGAALAASVGLTAGSLGLDRAASPLRLELAIPAIGTPRVLPAPAAPAAQSAKEDRARFQSLLQRLAELSQGKGLDFTAKTLKRLPGGGITYAVAREAYSLQLRPDAQYPDAFSAMFSSPKHSFSTLVAYEGFNNFIMGRLTVEKQGGKVIYRHTFDGYFSDIITVEVSGDEVTRFTYEKKNPAPQRITFYSLEYPAGDEPGQR